MCNGDGGGDVSRGISIINRLLLYVCVWGVDFEIRSGQGAGVAEEMTDLPKQLPIPLPS